MSAGQRAGLRDDMLVWLREQITARKAVAEAATEGPWEVTGQDGLGDAWQIHGGVDKDGGTLVDWNSGDPVEVPARHRVATLNYEDGGGVWRRQDADHIVINQPSRILADCDTQLRVLDDYEDALRDVDSDDPALNHEVCSQIAGILQDVVAMYAEDYGWQGRKTAAPEAAP